MSSPTNIISYKFKKCIHTTQGVADLTKIVGGAKIIHEKFIHYCH